MSALLAFATGAAAAGAALQVAGGLSGAARTGSTRIVEAGAGALDSLLRLGREGREPGAVERRRVLVAGALVLFTAGALVAGPAAGLVLALGGPTLAGRALRARRIAYRRAVCRDAPALALAVADTLSGGHSLRGALAEAAQGLGGPGGAELRRVAAELSAGAHTDAALEALRMRAGASAIDALVAAMLLQRRSGGDLAALLRSLARGFQDQQRLDDEVRAATAQARFSGLLVVLLPAGGALLAELASPGFLLGLAASPVAAPLVVVALVLQVAAALLIRRLGRPRG